MNTTTIELVDRGRGLQLSTIRVTVQDLVPYFQEGCAPEEIRRWIPALTFEEIQVVHEYYVDHKAELDEEDGCIRERNAKRRNPEWIEDVLKEARVERMAIMERLRKESTNGDCK